jgi:hypothetical protein
MGLCIRVTLFQPFIVLGEIDPTVNKDALVSEVPYATLMLTLIVRIVLAAINA